MLTRLLIILAMLLVSTQANGQEKKPTLVENYHKIFSNSKSKQNAPDAEYKRVILNNIADLEEALASHPDDSELVVRLSQQIAQLYVELKEYSKAIAQYQGLIDRFADNKALLSSCAEAIDNLKNIIKNK